VNEAGALSVVFDPATDLAALGGVALWAAQRSRSKKAMVSAAKRV